MRNIIAIIKLISIAFIISLAFIFYDFEKALLISLIFIYTSWKTASKQATEANLKSFNKSLYESRQGNGLDVSRQGNENNRHNY